MNAADSEMAGTGDSLKGALDEAVETGTLSLTPFDLTPTEAADAILAVFFARWDAKDGKDE